MNKENDKSLLNGLLLVWQQEQELGRDVTTDLCRDHPELATELSEQIRKLRHMNGLLLPAQESTLDAKAEAPGNAVSPVASSDANRTLPPSDAWAMLPTTVGLSPQIAAAGSVVDDLPAGVPTCIGGYRLERRLGGGGMGAVYQAQDVTTGRRVAVKLMLPEFADSVEALVRFRQEGRLASAVSHPRCVFVIAADEDAGRYYIVMELMPGATLSDLVRQRGPLPVEEAIAKILDVIDGLVEVHRHGLVHRDVKPSNCFLEAGGRVKIGDFGLARSLEIDSKVTRTGAFVGTPLYAAPEQIHKKAPTDAQSDVYSVAATLYFLLTGRAPFETGSDAFATLARIVIDDPPPMRSARPELPRNLDRVVLRGLERDRRRRYRDLAELRRELLVFLPAQPSVSGVGLRFGAEMIDLLVRVALGAVVGGGIFELAITVGVVPRLSFLQSLTAYGIPMGFAICVIYYGVFEGVWGYALGKWLLRLRVGRPGSVQPPGFWRAAARAAIFYLVFSLSGLINTTAQLPSPGTPGEGSGVRAAASDPGDAPRFFQVFVCCGWLCPHPNPSPGVAGEGS